MTDKVFEIGEYPKDGRLAKYEKELLKLLKEKDLEDLEPIMNFMGKIFLDCMEYLRKTLHASFPDIKLTVIFDEKEYDELLNKLDRAYGTRPRTKAVIVGVGHSNAEIFVCFPNHFKNKPIDFIGNLSVSYLEELVHSMYPERGETGIHETLCSAIEGFLEMKLPECIRKKRLEYAEMCDRDHRTKNDFRSV
jgi:hypothetical protein